MITLHLLRHAKSSWQQNDLNDIDRPLNTRGVKACHSIGKYLTNIIHRQTSVMLSPACRAQQTWSLISEQLNNQPLCTSTHGALYTFDAAQLLAFVCQLDNSHTEVLLVGHNPAIEELASYMVSEFTQHVPTCAFLTLVSDISTWQEADGATFSIVEYVTPRQIAS